jgi:uncharacterized protein YcfJ
MNFPPTSRISFAPTTAGRERMRIVALGLLAATALAGCTDTYGTRSAGYRGYSSYDYNRPDPSYGGYYADRYYRDDRRYRERRLSRDERVYRGQDGRYYCRRSDGTTGLIVGGVAGGLLGNIIAPGGSETLGTVLGAAAGAAVGSSVDRNNQDVRCR